VIPPSPAQIKARLTTDLAAGLTKLRRKTAKSVRKAGGTKLTFTWLVPGTATVSWTARHKTIARGRATRTTTGTGTIRVKLTKAGRSLLKRAPRTKVKATVVFTDTGLHRVSASKTFKLRRR
jgi:hypothetical protein